MTDIKLPELPELCVALGWQGGTIHQVLAEIKRLKAIEQDRASRGDARDAARYRWLRDNEEATWRPWNLRDGCTGAMADAAVDHAMKFDPALKAQGQGG